MLIEKEKYLITPSEDIGTYVPLEAVYLNGVFESQSYGTFPEEEVCRCWCLAELSVNEKNFILTSIENLLDQISECRAIVKSEMLNKLNSYLDKRVKK